MGRSVSAAGRDQDKRWLRMTGVEATGLAIVNEVLGSVPSQVRTSFFKAISDLLGGLTAIPAAKFRQIAQGIEDTTAARSAIAAVVTKGIAADNLSDPLLRQAAAEIYTPDLLRKARNRILVAQKAAEHIADSDGENPNALPPNDDWMNYYARLAEDASSDNLQDLFGRILAGEVLRPSSFSASTMRTVLELDQAIAVDFSLVWSKSVGEAVDFSPDFQRGEWFARWQRLAEAGLMAPNNAAQFLPPFNPLVNGNGLWTPFAAESAFIAVHFPEHCGAQWRYIGFTRVGREIGIILEKP